MKLIFQLIFFNIILVLGLIGCDTSHDKTEQSLIQDKNILAPLATEIEEENNEEVLKDRFEEIKENTYEIQPIITFSDELEIYQEKSYEEELTLNDEVKEEVDGDIFNLFEEEEEEEMSENLTFQDEEISESHEDEKEIEIIDGE